MNIRIPGYTTGSTCTWRNGQQHTIYLLATNSVGLTAPTQNSFYYDIGAPTVAVVAPNLSAQSASPTWLKTLTTISGTVNDLVANINNRGSVYIQIKDWSNATFFWS